MLGDYSDYSLSLSYLLKAYQDFVCHLSSYVSSSDPSSRKLKELLYLWKHPKGIQNLIKSLALRNNHEEHAPCNLAGKKNEVTTNVPILNVIEMENPLYNNSSLVKIEESEDLYKTNQPPLHNY